SLGAVGLGRRTVPIGGGGMQLHVKGKNLEVSDSIRSYAERKLGKLEKQLHALARVEVELAVERNPSVSENQVAEATVWLKGRTLRAREATRDMKASIDSLPDGSLLVEEGADSSLDALAAAVEQELRPPYRARGVRRGESMWAVEASRIEVLALPDAPGGDSIDVTRTSEGTILAVEGQRI